MPDHDPEVTPEQETRLRRLLAQARHGEPVPDDVAARLDRVLAQLATEEADPDAGASVVDLAARRRRRVTGLLVAAAAVVVIGIGVDQVVGGSGFDAESAGSNDASAASDESAGQEDSAAGGSSADAPATDPDADLQRFESSDTAPAPSTLTAPTDRGPGAASGRPRPPLRLTEAGFAKQAVTYVDRPGIEAGADALVPGSALSRDERFVCDTAEWGEGRLLPALYDGVPAVLAYRPVAGETQTADLLRCGTGEVLRSTVLPVEG